MRIFWVMIKHFVSNNGCKYVEDNNISTNPINVANAIMNDFYAYITTNIGNYQNSPVFNDLSHVYFVASSIDHFNSESHQSIFHINNSMIK